MSMVGPATPDGHGFEGLRFPRARLARTALCLAVSSTLACLPGEDGSSSDPGPGTVSPSPPSGEAGGAASPGPMPGESGGSAAPGAPSGEPGAGEPSEAGTPAPALPAGTSVCLTTGYGLAGDGVCAAPEILWAHVLENCRGSGGSPHDVAGASPSCAADAPEEMRLVCCYPEVHHPARLAVSPRESFEHALVAIPPSTRGDLLARARASCADEGRALTSWHILYNQTGTEPGAIRFSCRMGGPLDAAPAVPDNCQVQGYGIGAPGSRQCATVHLTAHAANACLEADGFPAETRARPSTCAAQAGEVQVLCCFGGAVPAPADLPATALSPLDRIIAATAEASTQEALTEAAQAECVSAGQRLGDWQVIYADDGEQTRAVRFGCN